MKTTQTIAFSIPIKTIARLPKLVQKMYADGKINKPTNSEAVSVVLQEALSLLPPDDALDPVPNIGMPAEHLQV